jgi:Holliday junction resolvase RusA-like endonuclease
VKTTKRKNGTETPSVFRKNGNSGTPKGEHTISVMGENRVRATRYFPTTEEKAQAIAGNKNGKGVSIEFFHQFQPPRATAQQRQHIGKGRSYLPCAAQKARAVLMAVFERHAPPAPISGALSVTLLWTWNAKKTVPKTTRPDLDNLAKFALDAMTDCGYWTDDAQVVELHTAKFLGPLPGIAVTVSQVEADQC